MFETLAQIPAQERWREQKHPLPIVGAIIRRDNLLDNSETDYLLIRRIKEPYQDLWALVGGKMVVDDKESPALHRFEEIAG